MAPIRWNAQTESLELTDRSARFFLLLKDAPGSAQRFFAFKGDASWLWPRWVFLRLLGVISLLASLGWLLEGQGLVGPLGILPIDQKLEALGMHQHWLEGVLRYPSFFWLSAGANAIYGVSLAGLLGSAALVLNVFPRGALILVWGSLLSFHSVSEAFRPTQLDPFLMEMLFLSLFLAPGGLRPGLGAGAPPRRFVMALFRLLIFRVMFFSGVAKFSSGDPHWRNLTAMKAMYETAPMPTWLGYYAHQLPSAFHTLEALFMILAELVAPLLALFLGRAGALAALVIWVIFQLGIAATGNFGWLNYGSIALGVLLLDDQMLARFLPAATPVRPVPLQRWKKIALAFPLGLHLFVACYLTGRVLGSSERVPPEGFEVLEPAFYAYGLAYPYHLYQYMPEHRFHLVLEGSNDSGKTWRTYEYRYLPQSLEKISPFIAPYLPRFEAIVHIYGLYHDTEDGLFFKALGRKLLWAQPEILGLFKGNPFSERLPDRVRFGLFEYKFADLAAHRKTGRYWSRTYIGERWPTLVINRETGEFREL